MDYKKFAISFIFAIALAFLFPNRKVEIKPAEICIDLCVFPMNTYTSLHYFRPKNSNEQFAVSYIRRYYKLAQLETPISKQPASVKLAQGLLETNKGRSFLSLTGNNHFGIKCFANNCMTGHCINREDDTKYDRFRLYPNVEQSYRQHSFLLSNKNYRICLDSKTAFDWCDCLQLRGYATSKSYAKQLKKFIKYNMLGD